MQPQGVTAGHSPTAPLHSPLPRHNMDKATPLADLDENFMNEAGNVYEGQLQGDGVSSLSALGPQPDQTSETAPDPLDISQDPPEGSITAPSNTLDGDVSMDGDPGHLRRDGRLRRHIKPPNRFT